MLTGNLMVRTYFELAGKVGAKAESGANLQVSARR